MKKFRMKFLTAEEVLEKVHYPLIFEIKACDENNKCEVTSFYSRTEAKMTVEALKSAGIRYTVHVRLPSNSAIKKLGIKVFD